MTSSTEELILTGPLLREFREILEGGLTRLAKGKGCSPLYDYVLLFKILILQRYYNLRDHQSGRRSGGEPNQRPNVLHAVFKADNCR